MTDFLDPGVRQLIADRITGLATCWQCPIARRSEGRLAEAGQEAVQRVLEDLIAILFPGCHGRATPRGETFEGRLRARLESTALALTEQITRALEYQSTLEPGKDRDACAARAAEVVRRLVDSLSQIQELLQRDIRAAYEGDPAAKSTMEVVMSYPGFYAITVHRIAHLLYRSGLPLIPRIMS